MQITTVKQDGIEIAIVSRERQSSCVMTPKTFLSTKPYWEKRRERLLSWDGNVKGRKGVPTEHLRPVTILLGVFWVSIWYYSGKDRTEKRRL